MPFVATDHVILTVKSPTGFVCEFLSDRCPSGYTVDNLRPTIKKGGQTSYPLCGDCFIFIF